MKSKFLIILFLALSLRSLYAENISITAENISFDKNENSTIFKIT